MTRLSEITQEQRERLRENANKMSGGLPFIQYTEKAVASGKDTIIISKFEMGDQDVTGNSFLAVIDRCEAVWICFGVTVKELVRVNMMDQEIPSRPQGYSDRDKWDKWDKGKSAGKPKDPLLLQYELPLITTDFDERVIMFKASTKLAKEAVKRLIDTANAKERLLRPYVTLTKDQNPDNEKQMLPNFTINDYSEDLKDIKLPGDDKSKKPASANGSSEFTVRAATNDPISTGNGAAPRRHSDMDDDIPF